MLDDGTEVLAAVDFDVGMVNRVAQSDGTTLVLAASRTGLLMKTGKSE